VLAAVVDKVNQGHIVKMPYLENCSDLLFDHSQLVAASNKSMMVNGIFEAYDSTNEKFGCFRKAPMFVANNANCSSKALIESSGTFFMDYPRLTIKDCIDFFHLVAANTTSDAEHTKVFVNRITGPVSFCYKRNIIWDFPFPVACP